MVFIEKSLEEPDVPIYKVSKSKLPDGTLVTKAERETAKAIEFYSNPAYYANEKKITKESGPEFNVYSDKKLKKKLKKIFNGKCAYCESYVIATAPGDIEHFRPKKKIVLPDGTELIPGYYWLAADWKNLLLSCGNCNRTTTQKINDGEEEITMGKLSQFPLSDESKRVRSHKDNLSTEENYILLLNPCTESPDNHFVFDDNGEVKAAVIDGKISMKGETSIQVYGLYRANLVSQRFEIIQTLNYVILNLYINIQDMKRFEDDEEYVDSKLDRMDKDMDQLIRLFSEKAIYLAMKRQRLERFIDENPIIYQNLLNVEIDLKELL